ncbi:hypothetical protein CK203_072021 [Vitis vinifera]|uniref:Uncharacterized protein n=1 Tax=Vitis vinifera TaxID=29760 RepID=A0A438EXB0_VITVI|nr:hypothetical protein CK203_072021 [Vitis vinifera]
MLWRETKDEIFLVKSLYSTLASRRVVQFPNSIIWSPCVPTKVCFFAWEASWGKVLTLDQLEKRGQFLANRCFLCCEEEESIDHILIQCSRARVLWELLFALFGVTWVLPFSVRYTFSGWCGFNLGKKRRKVWKTTPLCIFWVVWKERNRIAFDNEKLSIHRLKNSFVLVEGWFCISSSFLCLMAPLVYSPYAFGSASRTGSGRISACGGNGFGGGGGGRISVDVFSRHDDPKIFVHGGSSFGCPENSGAAGTFYDAVPRSLIVSNNNRSTDTDTLLLEFPYQPLWTNVYVRDHAKATVPLLWSRVQVQGQISLYCGGVLSFGLAHYALSEFELLAEELLMSDSIIKDNKGIGTLCMVVASFSSSHIKKNGMVDCQNGVVLDFPGMELFYDHFLFSGESFHSGSSGMGLGVKSEGWYKCQANCQSEAEAEVMTSKVYGALRMSVKMFLMWNSKLLIDGGGDANVATSLLEASNLVVLKESSVIHSNANLEFMDKTSCIVSCFGISFMLLSYVDWFTTVATKVGPGSVLRGPLENATTDAVTPRLYCELQDCPTELLHPPEDCNVNSSLSFTLQICRVEDITVQGLIKGSVVHFHRARTIAVQSSGKISTSRMGCTGGVGRGKFLSSGLGSGGGHGGKGGDGCYKGSCVEGGISYGNADLPCELGSGSGNDTLDGSTAGGGVIDAECTCSKLPTVNFSAFMSSNVMGSLEHPLSSLSIEGSVKADGESSRESTRNNYYSMNNGSNVNPGGGSGGTILLFLRSLALGEAAVLSSIGGHGSLHGGGGGGGGRIHFHWSDIPTGDVYQPIASVKGSIHSRILKLSHPNATNSPPQDHQPRDEHHLVTFQISRHQDTVLYLSGPEWYGGNGTVTGKACPRGLYGIFCEECPAGTYKNVTGSDRSLCHHCPYHELPRRAIYISVRGGIAETPCPYKCISDRYHMPHCYTALEELIYTFGGPWLFCLLLLGVLILLALVLSVARMKFVGVDESPGPAPTQHGSQIDHSFPFLESLNEVLETNRAEESQSHVHRMYFMGPNTFSEPWHLPHTPPEQIKEIVYEGAFNGFVDEINAIAAYQWWEGSMHSILSILAYPLHGHGSNGVGEKNCSNYVAATSDLMLAHVDFFLGGDEKRTDLPFRLQQRFPMSLPFGGDGSYMAPFSLNSDNILTSLMSQSLSYGILYFIPAGDPTNYLVSTGGWFECTVALSRRGRLRVTFRPVLRWLETHANPALRVHGVQVDLAWFQSTACGYCQYGLLVYAVEDETESTPVDGVDGAIQNEHQSRDFGAAMLLSGARRSTESLMKRKKPYGYILDTNSLHMLEEKKDIFYPLSFIIHNTKPVGQHDLVGLVISMLLLADISLVLLTLLQLYSISLADVFLVLFVLPLGILLPFPAGINALFSHGPRRSAGLARVYALWNITSLINVMVAFICGYVHYNTQSPSKKLPNFQPWNINMDDSEWWIIPTGLVVCKFIQSRLINWHIANLEIQDRSLYSNDFELFWQS